MKSLLTLLCQVIRECGDYSSVNTDRDIKTVTARFEAEGTSFITRSLPTFGSALEKALDREKATPDLFTFKCRQNLPVLFGGFMELIFDRASGSMLDEPSVEAIRSLRQITLMFKKIELPCGPKETSAAFSAFVESDNQVRNWERDVTVDRLIDFHRMSQILFSSVFSAVDREIRDYALEPKHGPGATAERLVSNQKFTFPSWTRRLEDVFPFWKYATTKSYSSEKYNRVNMVEPEDELPVRVISVPKTLDAPRIIAIEPSCMQYMQQGIARSINTHVNSSYLESMIGTKYQEPNQLLALQGSLTGDLATLDLSEASDRVSNLLVMTLVGGFPHLGDGIQACRSLKADVPENGVIDLARFASMGSALTFPIESMVFLTTVMLGIERAHRTRFTSIRDIVPYIGRVRVYGDDIIIPVESVSYVLYYLDLYGFKVNKGKSFWNGSFRESCGKEYFRGEDVTLCRFRREMPTHRNTVEEMVSAVSFRNQAYWRGLWKTAAHMDKILSDLIPLPVVADTSSVLGRESVLGYSSERICDKLHRPMVKGMVVRYRDRESPIDDDAALMKCLSRASEEVKTPFDILNTQADHLLVAGRPVSSSLKHRWGYSY